MGVMGTFAYKSTPICSFFLSRKMNNPDLNLKLAPAESYVPLVGLETQLKRAICHDLCGVHLLAMPPTTGKTTASLHVTKKLLTDKKISGAVYIDMNERGPLFQTFSEKIANTLKVEHEKLYPIIEGAVKRKQNPLLIIMDNVDNTVLNSTFRHDLVSLATRSVLTKHFVILMLLRQVKVAKIIHRWNCSAKIHMLVNKNTITDFHPADEEIRTAIKKQELFLNKSDEEIFFCLAKKSKSIGFVAETASFVRGISDLKEENSSVITPNFEASYISSAEEFHKMWEQMVLDVGVYF